MPKIKVLIKGLNKALEFPSGTSIPDIEKAIKGNWGQVEEGKRGFKSTTGDKSIDSNIKEIVSMTPDEYLTEAFNVTDGSLGGNFSSWMGSNARGAETRNKYASDMLRGDEFPLPYIDYAEGAQDGRNRAMAAKIAGINRIPVGIIPDKSVADKIAGIKSELLTAKGLKEYRLKNELERLLAASPKLAAATTVGAATLAPEEAQAQQMIANNMILDDSLRSLPSFTTATAPWVDQQKLPGHLRASVGEIEAPSQLVPNIVHDFGQALHNLEFPLVGKPLEGVADYLMNFGYDDSRQERLKRAAMAGLDII
jgi:hypothetical protein